MMVVPSQPRGFASSPNLGQLTADAAGSMTYHYTIEPVEKRFYRFRKP